MGGFIRSLFCLEQKDEVEAIALKISRTLNINPPEITVEKLDNLPLINWHQRFKQQMLAIALSSTKKSKSSVITETNEDNLVDEQRNEMEENQLLSQTDYSTKNNIINEKETEDKEKEETSKREFYEYINHLMSSMKRHNKSSPALVLN